MTKLRHQTRGFGWIMRFWANGGDVWTPSLNPANQIWVGCQPQPLTRSSNNCHIAEQTRADVGDRRVCEEQVFGPKNQCCRCFSSFRLIFPFQVLEAPTREAHKPPTSCSHTLRGRFLGARKVCQDRWTSGIVDWILPTFVVHRASM